MSRISCINKNSTFFKALKSHGFDANEIAQITDKISQPSFEEWYGSAELDSFQQPRLVKDLYITNDKGETITLNDLLNDKFYEKRENYSKDLTYLDKIDSFLEEARIGITKRISAYKGSDYSEKLSKLLEDLDALEKNDYLKALEKHSEYILNTVEDFELRFYEYDRENKTKLTKEEKFKSDKKYKNFLMHANNFLQTFSKIKTLELPVNDIKESQVIDRLRNLETRVTNLQNKVEAEVESSIRETLNDLISNPEVRNGVIDFLAAQIDEGWSQLYLDALGDSHVTFIAAIDKFYKRAMHEKDIEVKKYNKDWDKILSRYEENFNSFLDRILEKKDGVRTGKFIQEYQDEYYEALYEYTSKLRSIENKKSSEYRKALDEYFTWKKENTEQRFVKQYYDDLNILTPKAREFKENIDVLKSKILSKGITKLNLDDFTQLQKLDRQIKETKSTVDLKGNKKVGDELDIANSLFKYSQAMAKYYETTSVNEKGFNRAKKQAKDKGEEDLQDWIKNNTVETFSDDFWNFFTKLISSIPKSNELVEIEEKIKQLLITYKNEKNEIKAGELPSDIRKELNILYNRKRAVKESLNMKMDLVERKRISNEFKRHLEFVPTKYYLKELSTYRKDLEEKKISQATYDKWYNENHEINDYTGEASPKSIWTVMRPRNKKFIIISPSNRWKSTSIKQEFHNSKYKEDDNGFPSPTDKWKNSEYLNLNEEDLSSLNEIRNMLLELTEHTKNDIIKKGYLPAFPKDNRTAMEILRNKKPSKEGDFSEKAVTESNEIVKFIPFKYVKRINQQALPELGSGATEEENKKIEEERKRIISENRKAHGDSVDYNLKDTMRQFIKTALTNKYKSDIEIDIKLFKEQMKHQKIKETDAKGKPIFDKLKSAVKGNKVEYETGAEGSNIEKHFEEWIDGVFYENFEHDEGIMSDITKRIQDFTSLRALGFNVLSTVNNKLIGNLQARIESAGGQYFDYSDYRKARREYFNSVHHFIANHKTEKSDNRIDAFNKYFDVMISQDELSNKPNGSIKTLMYKLRMIKDIAFLGQHLGEHQIQNTALLAMSYSHRIVDGKIINFNEFFENRQIKIEYKTDMSEEERTKELEAISKNHLLRKSLEEEFEKYPTLADSYELKDGYLVLKDGIELEKNEEFNFKQRVIGVNQRLHGIYNTDDAAIIQRNVIGRLAMQFRKWIRPGWNRRFGRRFGKKDYNERMRDYEEGMYITSFKFIATPFSGAYKEIRNKEESVAEAAFGAIIVGMKDLIFDSKIRWHTMSEMEKANIKKTVMEFLFLISVIALGFVVKSLKGDDDDKFLTFSLYQADRLFGELSTFTPLGVVREGNRLFKSPSPVFNTFEDVIKLGSNMFLYPFRDEEERKFKSGIYHGEDKVDIYAKDLIPVYTQLQKIVYMNENTQRYGMFK